VWRVEDLRIVRNSNRNKVLLLTSGLFFAIGLLALIGPALPDLARNNNSDLASAGAIFTALFLGSIPAQLVSGWLNDKYGPVPIMVVGMVIMAVGLVGVTLSHSMLWTLALMGFAGVGDGALVVGANVIVAQTFARRRATALSMMNVFYGIGAVIGPILVGVSLGIWQTALPAVASVSILLLLLLPVTRGLQKGHRELLARAEEDAQDREPTGQGKLYRSPLLWLMAALLMVYVGTEVGIGGWIATYTHRTTLIPTETAALVASGFYLALTGGRLVGAALGTRLRSEQILMVSLLGAVVGGTGMLLGVGNIELTIGAVLVTGAAFGPIYPTVLAVTAARFAAVHAGKAAALVMAVGSIGGMILPWLFGILLVGLGAQSLAQAVALLILVMLSVFSLSGIVTRRMDRVSVPAGERVA
jgi:MFS transporter, FHS family, L-fucose permease